MSLLAISSTASRHLRRQVPSTVGAASSPSLRIGGGSSVTSAASRRHFADEAKGSGLRRAQSKKGRRAPKPQASQSSAAAAASDGAAESQLRVDPHSIANEMVSSAAAEGRTPGTESVATLTSEQKMSNFAMAAGLFGFVSYIFYYSLASVGGGENAKALLFGSSDDTQQNQEGANPGFEEFLKEANEGRTLEEKRLREESQAKGEARELAELESSTAARLKAEGVGEDDIGAANEEEEREMARVAGFSDGGAEGGAAAKKRPLWKRVVFFWRRE